MTLGNMTFIIFIAVMILLIFKYLKSSPQKKNRKRRQKGKPISDTKPHDTSNDTSNDSSQTIHPYHNVTIEITGSGCQAAKEINGIHFLSKQAPSIPLAECDSSACQCHYKHSEDRRDERVERRIDYGVAHDLYGAFGEKNRRVNKQDRRNEDK